MSFQLPRGLGCAWVCLTLGCASAAPPAQVATASVTAPVTAPRLHGFWSEYWSPVGAADTRRFVFLQDGRFGWLAPARDTPNVEPLQRSGSYRLDGQALVLEIQRERYSGCAAPCAHAGEPRVVVHERAPVEALELGTCPPNQEAQALDASYRCLSIGGRAFWRRADAAGADAAPYFE